MICGVYTEYSSVWLMPAVWIYIEFGKRERMIKMIELTTAAYWTLIVLSAIGGYILHGVIDAIKDGTFFD